MFAGDPLSSCIMKTISKKLQSTYNLSRLRRSLMCYSVGILKGSSLFSKKRRKGALYDCKITNDFCIRKHDISTFGVRTVVVKLVFLSFMQNDVCPF